MEYQKNIATAATTAKPAPATTGPVPAVNMWPILAKHEIKAGDTISKIAERYYGKGNHEHAKEILEFNPSIKANKLKIGAIIEIPQLSDDAQIPNYPDPKPPRAEKGTYTVQPGDTLSGISLKVYNSATKWKIIESANPGIDANNLKAGTVLSIPEPNNPVEAYEKYAIQKGDTLRKIARKNLGDPELAHVIKADNPGLTDENLKVGQKIRIRKTEITEKSEDTTRVVPDTRVALSIADRVLANLSGEMKKMLSSKLGAINATKDDLYKLAERAGISLTPDGIRELQRRRELKVSGSIDPKTALAIYNEISYCMYRDTVKQNPNYKWVDTPGKIQIVGLRGFNLETGRNSNQFNQWNDTLAIVWKDEKGRACVREFVATTEPGIKKGSAEAGTPDVDGDGRRDTAHMRPGQYRLTPGEHKGHWGALRPLGKVDVDRDTNQDGLISERERQASIARNDSSIDCNIHAGKRIDRPAGLSAGCQVPRITWNEFHKLISPFYVETTGEHNSTQSIVYYTLVDCSKR